MENETGRIKVLIVEDSYMERLMLSEAFCGPYSVITANNGVEALNILNSNNDISIVLLDIVMPEMDGFEVLTIMKSTSGLCKIPVIIITSENDSETQIRALDLGAYDVLFKPLNPRLVIHRVQNILTSMVASSIQDPEKMYQQMMVKSDIDEKTGIYNRQKFIRKASSLLTTNNSTKYYLLRWDIDGFKVLNDACGTAEGDRLLAAMGQTCRLIADPSVVYGHWEADHFVAVMSEAVFRKQRIVSLVNKPFPFSNPYFTIQLRLGIYSIDDHYMDVRIMCDRAMMALKSVKNSYTRRYAYFDESMRSKIVEERQIVNECKSALDNGQFVVYLQPQYDYSSGMLHGAEALIRWRHPTRGLIPPIKFIPIFEKNGFITKLDEYVWEEVCKLQRTWIDEGVDIVPISVNVSRVDIGSSHLCDFLEELMVKYNLPKEVLRLEITESAYMDNPSLLINSVSTLQSKGFSVEMDDFGSGYSSLNTLKEVPVDMLKLDMKFLEKGDNDDRGGSILSSVVRMSNWLRLPVIAEGVETKSQADYLKSIGCVFMQGYYFAKPMPVQEFEVLLRSFAYNSESVVLHDETDMDSAYEFLNASTQATLLFNSFVGGAAIVEYSEEMIETIRINDRFYSTLGVHQTDFVNRAINLLDAFDDNNRQILIKAFDRAVMSKMESSCEVCSKNLKKNEDVWMKIRIRLLAINSGKNLCYLAVDNITQRMNLLMDNMQLSEQLVTIMNNIPSGIVDYEIRGNKYGIIFFNDNAASMFGYSREEYEECFLNDPLAAIHPEETELCRGEITELIKTGQESFKLSYRHKCKDGRYKKISFGGNIVRRNADAIFISGILNEMA